MSVSGPGIVAAVANISSRSYMIPWVEYSGKMIRSMPGSPCLMPVSMAAMFFALSMTSPVVCRRGIL
jgi:hypothetical protein